MRFGQWTLKKDNRVLCTAFSSLNLPIKEIIDYVFYIASSLEKNLDSPENITYSPEIGRVLERAHEISLELYCDYVAEEHLFLSILEDDTSPLEEFLYSLNRSAHHV